MRHLSLQQRLQGPSSREIVFRWEGVAHEVSRHISWRGRKLRPGPLLSAVIVAFTDCLTPEEQLDLAKRGVARMAEILDGPEMPAPEAPAVEAPERVEVKVRNLPGKSVRRKKGR